ncbi:hypothetical protein YC2023_009058 [Brassica napus]
MMKRSSTGAIFPFLRVPCTPLHIHLRAQGREMYHYKRRKGRAHQDSMQEDGKDGVG